VRLSTQKAWDMRHAIVAGEILVRYVCCKYSERACPTYRGYSTSLMWFPECSPMLGSQHTSGRHVTESCWRPLNRCQDFTAHLSIHGAQIDSDGIHWLDCCKLAGHQLQRSVIDDLIIRLLAKANVPSSFEPTLQCRDDVKRRDYPTVLQWANVWCLVCDFTCPHISATSQI